MSWATDDDDVVRSGPALCMDIARKLDPLFAEPEPAAPTKELLNEIPFVPGQEHMKVYLRVRPFSEGEKEKQEDQVSPVHADTFTEFTFSGFSELSKGISEQHVNISNLFTA